jgi:hypothetical protein
MTGAKKLFDSSGNMFNPSAISYSLKVKQVKIKKEKNDR